MTPPALSDPATWGAEPPEPVREVETHVSRVFLVGDRAFKLKKPVRMPFLDFRRLDARRHACEAEVALNRRLAPATYLGVRALVADGEGLRLADADAPGAVDYVVAMRRFDERQTLAAVAVAAGGTADVDAVAVRLARFHAGAPVSPGPGAAHRVATTLADSFATLSRLHHDRSRVAALHRAAATFLARRWRRLEEREAAGRVREGHGDLRAEHVVLRPVLEIIDCVEFSADLRTEDVGADVAFLVMDLTRLGRSDLAARFLAAYREAGGDPGEDPLVAFFAMGRALVRAKVALLRAEQVGGERQAGARAEAESLMAVAERFEWQARGPLAVVVCGPAASGKSTLAGALAARSGFRAVSSDAVRKALAGIGPQERGGPGLYDEEHDRSAYAALLAAAFDGSGSSVIVDATFRDEERRDEIVRAARAAGLRLLVLECRLPEAELLRRARIRDARGDAVSDATTPVVRQQAAAWRTWLTAPAAGYAVVRTDVPIAAQIAAAADCADRS